MFKAQIVYRFVEKLRRLTGDHKAMCKSLRSPLLVRVLRGQLNVHAFIEIAANKFFASSN